MIQKIVATRLAVKRAMLLTVFTVIGICSVHERLIAQTPLDSINIQLRHMYQYVHTPTPSANFLYDMAAHELDSNYFVGYNLQDTINTDFWFKIYEELRNSAFDTTAMERHDTVYYRTMQQYPDTVSLMVLDYKYYKFRSDALSTGNYFYFDTINNYVTDIYPNVVFPFNYPDDVFAVAPNKLSVSNRHVVYKIDPANIFKDIFSYLNYGYSFSLDFGEGTGWHTFPVNTVSYFTVNYPDSGNYCLTAIITDGSPDLYPPTHLSKSALSIISNLESILPDDNFLSNGADVNVYFPCESSGKPYEKVIIYLEGIDPMDFFPGAGNSAADNYRNSVQLSGLADLQNFGYTFLVVDWRNSRQPIEANAMVLYDIISRLKCQMQELGYEEEFVVIGESMGGLVARYCLTYMETHPTVCRPEKLHNTRLFMTFDTPHRGANVPLALQHAYRTLVSATFGVSSITQQAAGLINNMFLDAASAKQMLIYHVDTYNPLLPFSPYGPHPMKAAFDMTLDAMGNYPQFCKMVALSNGSLKGIGQTRDWDGSIRIPNDKLLHFRNEQFVRVRHPFGEIRFKIAGTEADMRTAPNGNGRIASFEHGLFWIRVKLKIFGINIHTGYNSFLGKYFDGLTLPIDTKPGGIYSESGLPSKAWATMQQLLPNFGSRRLVNSPGSGTWAVDYSTGGDIGLNVNTSIYSDGFHWNFIPSWSALDYPPNPTIDPNIEDESISIKTAATPFDVIMGITENYPGGNLWGLNKYRFNRSHHFIQNDQLRSNGALQYYKDDCQGPVSIRCLNREIGDDSLIIENRLLPWQVQYDAEWHIDVNTRSRYYEYPSTTTFTDLVAGTYSKEDPFIIDPTYGFAMLTANGPSVNYQPPYSGPYATNDLGWHKCCQPYSTAGNKPEMNNNQPIREMALSNSVLLFPNPSHGDFVIQFNAVKDVQSTVAVYDIMGRKIFYKQVNILANAAKYNLPVHLKGPVASGIYRVVLSNANKIYSGKLSITN